MLQGVAMSKKFWAVMTAVVIAGLPLTASAEYVPNKAKWRELSDQARAGYAMGSFDMLSIQHENSDGWNAAVRGRVACVQARQYIASDLVTLIDDQYLRESADTPTIIVMTNAMNRACSTFINTERAKLGLPAKTF